MPGVKAELYKLGGYSMAVIKPWEIAQNVPTISNIIIIIIIIVLAWGKYFDMTLHEESRRPSLKFTSKCEYNQESLVLP
jgi:hypothetical protein